MMSIPDKNETIYQVIYTSITGVRNMKVLKEFGFFNYFVVPGETDECKFYIFFNYIFINSTYNGILSIGLRQNI